MTKFNGLIGLEQLSPEVLEFFQNLINEAIANSGGIINPPVEPVESVILKGKVITSATEPADKADVWIKPTDGSIQGVLVSGNIIFDEVEPTNPSPGDVFVKKEN